MSDFVAVNEANFKAEVLDSQLPVLLEFGATWCHPCKQLEPLLKQLADGWQDKVRLVHVDADQASNLTSRYGVLSLPTTLLFIGGQVKERVSGFHPKEQLQAKFYPFLRG